MTNAVPNSLFSRYWILLGGLLLALGYLPMLQAPFDFTDDGNLVYGAERGTTFPQYFARWWDRVAANVDHLGPFRPVLWAHWELAANTFQDSPVIWRGAKLLWCAFAASMLLWLLKELRLPPVAALIASAAAIWNPYRNEIFTSLTLAEGVAMPYALLALVAARKASFREKKWPWDALAILAWVLTLGCKNTFVALLPAMLVLRCWPEGVSLREGLVQARWILGAYLLPLALPVGHFIYFKLNWHAGQYETPGPSLAQLGKIASWLKGAAGLDFLGVGLAITGLLQVRQLGELFKTYRVACRMGIVLAASGVMVYLPMNMMAARYTMPAVWGLDVLFAVLVAGLLQLNLNWKSQTAWAAIGVGLAAIMVANVGRQERLIARHRMLWDALNYVETTAPKGTMVEWISGDTGPTALNVEEGIHFAWHLLHRGRGDVQVGLVNQQGEPLNRVEVPLYDGSASYRLTMTPNEPLLPWRTDKSFARSYRFGKKVYACQVQVRVPTTSPGLDPWTMQVMKNSFENPDASLLQKLSESRGQRDPLLGAKAEVKKK